MTQREFHFQDGTSAKFWRIERDGCGYTTWWGRIGSAGQTQTKRFDAEAQAAAAYEKQIADKLKKGYREVAPAADVPAAPTSQSAQSAPTTPQAPTTPERAAEPLAAPTHYAATRAIDHEPLDRIWTTWRPWEPWARPAPQPFDLKDALRRLERVSNDAYRWHWRWERADIPAVPSRPEAEFWLRALAAFPEARKTPRDIAADLATQHFDGALSCQQAVALTDLNRDTEATFRTALLAAFCRPQELVAALIGTLPGLEVAQHTRLRALSGLIRGMREFVLPYLDPDTRGALSTMLTSHLDIHAWPADLYAAGPPAWYLAAMLGGHQALLLALVESWPADRYTGLSWDTSHYHRPQEMIFGLDDPRLVEAHMRRLKLRLTTPEYVRVWLAHTGLGALDLVRDTVLAEQNKAEAAALAAAFGRAVAPEVAPFMLELLHSSRAPQVARDWLDTHPAETIAGLVPVAATRGTWTVAAADLLRKLARRGLGPQIAAQLAALPPESAARLRAEILEAVSAEPLPIDTATLPAALRDALASAATVSARAQTLPSWLQLDELPPVVVGTGRLETRSVQTLLGALRRSALDAPEPLLATLKRHADTAALAAWAWALFEQWLTEGGPSKESWALWALGLMGDDTTALRLAPLVRVWPGESQHQRAVAGIECLRAIGTDAAIMQINGIAQKVKFKALQARAAAALEAIAQERRLSRSQLEDRVVPDCDLDARGERVFDFGARQFRFALGPELKPMVRDADGKLKPDLPKPNARDDAGKAVAAAGEWKLLKKQVAEVAKIQAVRLEQAMVTGRRWTNAEFEALLVRHPLLTHLVRTLVWEALDTTDARAATFRVTEDQCYADSADAPLDPTAWSDVRLVHPLQLTTAERAAWGEILSDYEIVPPFPQLGRPIERLAPAEQQSREITRWGEVEIPAATLVYGLDKRGWLRDLPADAGGFGGHSKPFPQAGVTAVVAYEEGVAIGYIVDAPAQTVRYLAFVPGLQAPEYYPRHEDRLPLGDVSPVVVSEALYDLLSIMQKAT